MCIPCVGAQGHYQRVLNPPELGFQSLVGDQMLGGAGEEGKKQRQVGL